MGLIAGIASGGGVAVVGVAVLLVVMSVLIVVNKQRSRRAPTYTDLQYEVYGTHPLTTNPAYGVATAKEGP